jgi:uncharacterized protein with GYD domain
MPTYISLLRYTEQGIKNIKESPSRLELVRKAFQQVGAELKDFYLVNGQYDAICISEAPDEETIAKLMLKIGAAGNVRTETVRAFKEDEYRKIVQGI